MLKVANLSLGRGGRLIQQELSFSLNAGEVLQLLGPNGVGKSTVLHAVAGLLEPEQGQVLYGPDDISAQRDTWHQSLFFLPHRLPAHPVLTPVEVLQDSMALKGLTPSVTQIDEALLKVDLLDQADQAAGSLSAGQQRRIWLARLVLSLALLESETFWLLDEPLTSLDKDAQSLVCDLLKQQLARGGMALVTSHQALALPNLQTLTLEVCGQ